MKAYISITISALLVCSGCTATVKIPEVAEHDDPRPVFLFDHGLHSSLALSRDDGTLVRYVYGEWRWYARRETGVLRVLPTLLSDTQSALGRRELPGPPEVDVLLQQIRVEVNQIYAFDAPGDRIDDLISDLDSQFDSARDTLIYNEAYDLEFVHDPRPYHMGHNSNHVVADWIRSLGIEVRGNPASGAWRIVQ